jgi:hypothetical protein
MGPAVLNAASELSLAAIAAGLCTAAVGSVMWARKARRTHILIAAIGVGTAAYLSSLFPVNIHGPGAPVLFVILVVGLDAALLLLVLVARLAEQWFSGAST